METRAVRQRRWAFAALLVLGTAAVAFSFPPPPPFLAVLSGSAGLALLVGAGLWLGSAHGLGAPLFAHWGEGAVHRGWVAAALTIGSLTGAVLGALTLWWMRQPFVPGANVIHARIQAESLVAPWKRWLLSFDAAVLEELGFRLFLVSAIAWLLARRWSPGSRWSPGVRVGVAIGLSALVSGLAHLPPWLAAGPLESGFAATLMAANVFAGVVFGVVFRRWGIEAAIVSHLGADAIVRLAGPLVVGV